MIAFIRDIAAEVAAAVGMAEVAPVMMEEQEEVLDIFILLQLLLIIPLVVC